MANKIKGEVALSHDGVTYTMIFDFNAMADLEDFLGDGANAIELLQRQSVTGVPLSAREMRAIFYAGLLQRHPDMTPHLAGKILTSNAQRFSETLEAAFPEASGEVGNGNPVRARPRKSRAF